ncbi:MAG: MbnP family protein [Cytophagales bacterium]|nr:MbnP family protein [Cytophagales bacterium]
MKNIIMRILLISVSLYLISCGNDHADAPKATTGQIKINFDNVVGSSQLVLDKEYTNSHGEKYKVDILKYYISNICLKKADGLWYTHLQDSSYFLIDESHGTYVNLNNVPFDTYSELKFTVGVDSLRSTMDASKRKGVLDPAEGMYWSWNSGYIFLMMEGTSPSVSVSGVHTTSGSHHQRVESEGRYRFHIGGFGGYSSKTINNLRSTTLAMPNGATVSGTNTPSIHLIVDVAKVFYGTHDVKLATNSVVMFNEFSANVANNYIKMFTFDHLHNETPVKNSSHSH